MFNPHKIQVIFVDIDNTLYDHLHKTGFDQKSINALNKLYNIGIKIIICTARPIFSLRDFGVFNLLKYNGVIAANGAIRIYEDEWIDRMFFDKKDVRKIIDVCEKKHTTIELIPFDYHFYATPHTKNVDYHNEIYHEKRAPYKKYEDEDIVSMCLYSTSELDDQIKKEFPKNIHLFRFSDYGIDVVNRLHSKGEGVISLLNKMNVSPDFCLSFGDGEQDISMNKEVKYGIAMGNGEEELKKNSFDITKPVYFHGVYFYLKKMKLIKRKLF